MKLNKKFIVLIIINLFISCDRYNKDDSNELAKRFFSVYSDRSNMASFKSFYNDSISYENVSQGTGNLNIDTDYLINNIFNWRDKAISYDHDKMLNIENIVANDSIIVACGKVAGYTYNGNHFDEMRFTTWLYLDKNNQIKKQIDWFNYPLEDILELKEVQNHKEFKLDH